MAWRAALQLVVDSTVKCVERITVLDGFWHGFAGLVAHAGPGMRGGLMRGAMGCA